MNDQQKVIREKITDCRRLGFLCLFLSLFLYIGALLPTFKDEPWKSDILSLTSLAFLLSAFIFQWRIRKLKEKTED